MTLNALNPFAPAGPLQEVRASAWNPLTIPQNYVLLAGVRSPGLADVEGASLEWRLDVRRAFGLAGAIIVWTGRELSTFSIKCRLYEESDWDAWWTGWSKLLVKPALKTAVSGEAASMGIAGLPIKQAFDIHHPFLAFVGIRGAVCKKVYQPELTQESGEWTIRTDWIEFRGLPKLAIAKADGAKSGPEPENENQKEIDRLTKQRDALAPIVQ
jgi:hypothetical protein